MKNKKKSATSVQKCTKSAEKCTKSVREVPKADEYENPMRVRYDVPEIGIRWTHAQ